MKKSEQFLERLKVMLDDNSGNYTRAIIEEAFPEVIDHTPYIKNNQLFVRTGHQKSLYQLVRQEGQLMVRNLTSNIEWSNRVSAANSGEHYTEWYLTKEEFRRLLGMSGVLLPSVVVLDKDDINTIHGTFIKRASNGNTRR